MVSIFDSLFGKWLATFVLESGVSPLDRDSWSVLMDQDTFVFTLQRASDNRMQYKVLRLNRRFGGMHHSLSKRQEPP